MARRLLVVLLTVSTLGTAFSALAWAASSPTGSSTTGDGPADRLLALGAGDRYLVTFVERREERQVDGELAEGESRTYAFDLRIDNLTRVDAVLSWVETGDAIGASAEDTFRLELKAPGGVHVDRSPTRGGGNVLVLRSGALNAAPAEGEVGQEGLDAVLSERGLVGKGTWRATIGLEDTGDPAGSQVDKSNAYVLTLVVRWYEARVLREVDLSPPQTLTGSIVPVSAWEWATLGLGGLSALLGVALVVDRRKKR